MADSDHAVDRRDFLGNSLRVATAVAAGAAAGFLTGQRGQAAESCWQINPDKCIACTRCSTACVLDPSAVRCVQCYDICGYCDICTGYLGANYRAIDTAAENQLCPTDAIERKFIEEKAGQRFFEYNIDVERCIGCGKCVQGCALMNGSLYLQVMQDRCVQCNECAIAVACPTQAFVRLPAGRPYRLKRRAWRLIQRKAADPANEQAREFLAQVSEP